MAGSTKSTGTARRPRAAVAPSDPAAFAIQHVSPAQMRQALAVLGLAGEAARFPGRFVLIEITREKGKDRVRRIFNAPAARTSPCPAELRGPARRAEIIAHATEALDGQANAMQWLQQSNRSLAGRSPLEVLTDGPPEAAERVDELLYGLEYGMFA